MKTTIQVLLCTLLCVLSLLSNAQIFAPFNPGVNVSDPRFPIDELLVSYLPGTTQGQKQDARERYDVLTYTDINGTLEIWRNLDFPLTVDDGNGSSVILYDLGDMLFDLDLQNNATGNHNDARANINGGDYNYDISLPNNNPPPFGGTREFILSSCFSSYPHLIGSTGTANANTTPVIIIDQVLSGHEGGSSTPGAPTSHADRVAYVIDHTAGLTPSDYQIISLPVFDSNGESTYAQLIQAFKWLEDWPITDGIINLSASMPIYSRNFSEPIREYIDQVLENNNLLLVSSAGNDNLSGEVLMFPGGDLFENEITVVGTENCFTAPWANTNSNRFHFEIAAEAKDVIVPLTHAFPSGQQLFGLEQGTSYSAPMVTGALIQLATHYPTFDAQTLKTRLLDRADQAPALQPYVQMGRVLNTTSATDFTALLLGQQPNNPSINSTELTLATEPTSELKAYPNPFQQWVKLQVPAEMQGPPTTLIIRDQLGRIMHTQQFSELGYELQLQGPELGQLPAGMFYLSLENDQQTTTLRLNKQ